MSPANADRIIIALDVQTKEEAIALVGRLPDARTFKVGLELFTAEGPALFRPLKVLRKDIFLDLKLHDIPNTVSGAVRSALKHGVQMMTLHASGGRDMMARAAEAARAAAGEASGPKPLLLGVTVLTSLKGSDLGEIGQGEDVAAQVLRLAGLVKAAGLDGVVCSPREIEALRREFGRELVIVTPGIRPVWAAAQDQKRIMTPAEAVAAGADYLVIGRPITGAPSPNEAFLRIVEELDQSRP
ncbi:MAG TPA: orotidine-5'-phosphate decarboxylase [Candidatus Aminicenantes bacterium]|nr:orotidine-5'-phosphate decarboxylase [Candidatus Aminicenantes bacterium]HRY63770.1 orotidine-5'-phosphate decarboxylase [Candidatus Aminicenantes bacterium]HRZ70683.1 orotidine-5'-phosphate decarboxylase [Candidatus Aminicenantes bacterium]